ncbi:unnamed protein product [Ectocarpus sp. 8 AP-2014]
MTVLFFFSRVLFFFLLVFSFAVHMLFRSEGTRITNVCRRSSSAVKGVLRFFWVSRRQRLLSALRWVGTARRCSTAGRLAGRWLLPCWR